MADARRVENCALTSQKLPTYFPSRMLGTGLLPIPNAFDAR